MNEKYDREIQRNKDAKFAVFIRVTTVILITLFTGIIAILVAMILAL